VAVDVELFVVVTVQVVEAPRAIGSGAHDFETRIADGCRTTVTGKVTAVVPDLKVTVANLVAPSGMSRPSTVMLIVFEAPAPIEKFFGATVTFRPASEWTLAVYDRLDPTTLVSVR